MRATAGDDLEVLPVDVAIDAVPEVARQPRATPTRTGLAAVVATGVTVAAAVAVVRITNRDGPAADTRVLVGAWARAQRITDVADDAAIRVRILVPSDGSDAAFRGLTAVRTEERDRLRALGAEVAAVDARDADVRRARDALVRGLDARERRAAVAAQYHAGGGDGTRTIDTIERAVAATTTRVADTLADLQRRHAVPPPTTPGLRSPALARSLGPLARVTDGRVGVRLALNLDARLVLFDPDAGTTGTAAPAAGPMSSVRSLVTLVDGTVLAWAADDTVRVVDAGRTRPRLGDGVAVGRPIPATRAGTVWIVTGNLTTMVSLDGTTIAGPYRQPTDQVVAAVGDDALVVFDPGSGDAPPTTSVWTPSTGAVRALATGIFLTASPDHVATETCAGDGGCALRVTDMATGVTTDVALPAEQRWSFGTASMSPDGRWLAATARTSGLDGGLLFVDLRTLRTSILPASAVNGELPATVAWAADSTRVFAVNERGDAAMWAAPRGTALHPIRVQVAYRDVIRVRDAVPIAE